jgi:hypothetical protein
MRSNRSISKNMVSVALLHDLINYNARYYVNYYIKSSCTKFKYQIPINRISTTSVGDISDSYDEHTKGYFPSGGGRAIL